LIHVRGPPVLLIALILLMPRHFQLLNRNFNETAAGYISSTLASGSGGPRIMRPVLRFEC
jgi:hypothetical protein